MTKRSRVLLANDDDRLTGLLRKWAEREKEFEIVGAVTREEAVVEAVWDTRPDLLVLGLHPGGLDGPGILRRLAAQGTMPLTLVLSSLNDEDRMVAVIKSGALGYLAKQDVGRWFGAAIRTVREGEAWLDRRSAARVIDELHRCVARSPSAATPQVVLTDCQRKVLVRIVQGRTNKQIGEDLHISAHTVKIHVTGLLRLLGLRNRVEVALYGERMGLDAIAGDSPARPSV